MQRLHRPFENGARVGKKRLPVAQVKTKQGLCSRFRRPGNGGQTAGYDIGQGVRIAVVATPGHSRNRVAQSIKENRSARDAESVGKDLAELLAANSFTTKYPGQVCYQQLHGIRARIAFQVRAQFGRLGLGSSFSHCQRVLVGSLDELLIF